MDNAALAVTAALLAAACTEGAGPELRPPPGAARDAVCPAGQIADVEGRCMPVGVQGCVDLFLDADNLCHPSMTRCPPGTIPRLDEGCISVSIPGCAPEFIEEDGLCHPTMKQCPEGSFAVPGEGCVPVDGPDGCGTGRWGGIAEGPANVYVDPSYGGADGDGSQTRPLRTIAAALARAQDAGRIALAEGIYDEPVTIRRSIELVGRCASKVRIQGVQEAFGSPIIVAIDGAAGVTLRGLTLGGAGIGVAAIRSPAVTLDRVHIERATAAGVVVHGVEAEVSISHSWIEGTVAGAGGPGFGARVELGGTLALDASALSENHAIAIYTTDQGETAVRGSLVEGTLPAPNGVDGAGLVAHKGARLLVERSAIVDNAAVGVLVEHEASAAQLRSTLIETSLVSSRDVIGSGALANAGGTLTVDASALIAGSPVVSAYGSGTATAVTRSLIEGAPVELASLQGGFGVEAASGGQMSVESSALWRNRGGGVKSEDAGTTLTVVQSVIESSTSDDGQNGFGAFLIGGDVALKSSAFIANQLVGVNASGADAAVTLTMAADLVEGTSPEEASGYYGNGVYLESGARATMDGLAILENHGVGLGLVEMDATVMGTLIEGTGSGAQDLPLGNGVVALASRLSLSSAILRDNRTAAVYLSDKSVATVDRIWIDGVSGGEIPFSDGSKLDRLGDGLLVTGGGELSITDAEITGCARAAMLFSDSSGMISRTRAHGNRFGLVVQGENRPNVSDDSTFTDNTEQDRYTGGDLPISDAPVPVP